MALTGLKQEFSSSHLVSLNQNRITKKGLKIHGCGIKAERDVEIKGCIFGRPPTIYYTRDQEGVGGISQLPLLPRGTDTGECLWGCVAPAWQYTELRLESRVHLLRWRLAPFTDGDLFGCDTEIRVRITVMRSVSVVKHTCCLSTPQTRPRTSACFSIVTCKETGMINSIIWLPTWLKKQIMYSPNY